jgi:hypothetical protein
MYLKLSALAMLGLACTSCASNLAKIATVGTPPNTIDVDRRSNGGIMVSQIAHAGAHASKPALTRQFDALARRAGCTNGALPKRDDSIEISGDRTYILATFYKCP